MPAFKYKARDRAGRMVIGDATAASLPDLREQLRKRHLFVTEMKEEIKRSQSGLFGLFRRRKPKLDEMVVMSRQLATLVKAGLPIIDALDSVIEQTTGAVLKEGLSAVRLDVLSGNTLTNAMRKHPLVFNELYTSLVEAGETGGLLEFTLETAAVLFDKEAELRNKVKSAFIYPILVILASFGMVAFMLVFIVPVFADVYKQFRCELPFVTLALVNVSFIIVHYSWAVLLGAIGMVMAIRRYIMTPGGRRRFDALKLRLPLLGKLIHKMCVSRFTRTFGGLTKAGVPILTALSTAANTAANVVVIEAVNKVRTFVKEGTNLSISLEQVKVFPSMVTRMVAAGEQSGNIDEMLEEVTRFFDRDIEYTVDRLTKILEPIMTVAVGGIVLFVLLALYMPIFNLTNVVKR